MSATLDGTTQNTTAGTDGLWLFAFERPAGGPFDIVFSGSGGTTTLSGILFGDVFLCGGQSNMAFNVAIAFNATAECARAVEPRYATMRVMAVGHATAGAPSPADELGSVSLMWTAPTHDSICHAGNFNAAFSAVCYFAGRTLFDALNGAVPIGLVSSAVASTAVAQWSPPEVRGRGGGGEVPSRATWRAGQLRRRRLRGEPPCVVCVFASMSVVASSERCPHVRTPLHLVRHAPFACPTRAQALAACPRHHDTNRCGDNGDGCLWNYGVAPLVRAPLPLALKAVVWYQASDFAAECCWVHASQPSCGGAAGGEACVRAHRWGC